MFGAAALLLGIALGGHATTMVRMDLDQLTAAASTVARVRCLANEWRVEDGTAWTLTTFEVLETLKGSTPPRITVRLVGGRAGNLRVRVEGVPRFEIGEEVYLFLEPNRAGELTVTSWAQGTFRVQRTSPKVELVTQDTGGVSIFDPETKQYRAGGVRNLPLAEFKQRVSEAVERLRQKGPTQ
jgi:hypothetical protein